MTEERGLGRDVWRALALALLFVTVLLALLLVRQLALPEVVDIPQPPPPEPELRLRHASFEDLPGWVDDDLDRLAEALSRSCGVQLKRTADRALSKTGLGGVAGDWHGFCRRLESAPAVGLRALIEEELRPWRMLDGLDDEGLLTGYYEPSLRGSRRPTEEFSVPLYRRPPELVTVDLGSFRDDLRGRRLAGSVNGDRLEPFADRAALEGGSLEGRGLELAWVDDAVDAFFLHIQGSGRVELDDGGMLRVGYAAQNGHPYVAIGRELVERGEMVLEEVSMQSIRAWLDTNPERAAEIMESNPSFVFFRELSGEGPLGSQGVALTPRRSLAVDRSWVPLGLPLWIDSTFPQASPEEEVRPLRRLMIAQDTGGAIRGPLRGDVFWGHGDEAAELAGRMKQPAHLWVLLPAAWEPGPEHREGGEIDEVGGAGEVGGAEG